MMRIKTYAKSLIKKRGKGNKKQAYLNEISHEMKTPLTIIIGYAQLLKDEEKYNIDSHFTKTINIIEAEGKRLHSLIDKYIDFSKQ